MVRDWGLVLEDIGIVAVVAAVLGAPLAGLIWFLAEKLLG